MGTDYSRFVSVPFPVEEPYTVYGRSQVRISVCGVCSALVDNEATHADWHREQDGGKA
ncbi:hypothetical protein M2390_003255 [Mycetocola sp. BIGb0189]|nr:hypothetical protein [Mycetocola sp. BIGb0189]